MSLIGRWVVMLSPRAHLATPGDIFDHHSLGRLMPLASSMERPRIPLIFYNEHDTFHNKELPNPKGIIAEVEKARCKLTCVNSTYFSYNSILSFISLSLKINRSVHKVSLLYLYRHIIKKVTKSKCIISRFSSLSVFYVG